MSFEERNFISHSSKNDEHSKPVENGTTHFVLKLKQGNETDKYGDLIESSAESLAPVYYKQRHDQQFQITEAERCIGPVCRNYSYPSLNGLCKECYDFLLEKKLCGSTKRYRMKSEFHSLRYNDEQLISNKSIDDSSHFSSTQTIDFDFERSDRNHNSVHQILPLDFVKLRLNDKKCDHHAILPDENSVNPTCVQQRTCADKTPILNLQEVDKHFKKGSPDVENSCDYRLSPLDLDEQDNTQLMRPLDRTIRPESRNQRKSFLDCSGFSEVADTIYNNCIVKSHKCKREGCTNFGNSKCRGFCNSCYRIEQ